MALNTAATYSKEFETILLANMVPTPDDKYVFRDIGLISNQTDLQGAAGAQKGLTYHLDQMTNLSGTYTEASRALTDGTALSTTPVTIAQSQYTVTLKEYGGPESTGVKPIGITEMLKRRAVHDVAQEVGRQLKRDYLKFQDRVLCDLALTTTAQTTADGTAAASITAGQLMSYEMLVKMAKALKARNVPKFPGDVYRIVISGQDWESLMLDTDFKDLFKTQNLAASPMVSGFLGRAAGFDIFESNLIPTVACGAGSAVTGYQSVAFGDGGCVGYLQALAPEPRASTDTDYGRQDLIVWYAIEGYGALDVNNWVEKGLTT